MKVLLDENMPHPLRRKLAADHEVFTTEHQGWKSVRNGNLLGKAEEAGFQVLVTADQSMSYQQKMTGRSLGLVVLSTPNWPQVQSGIAAIADAVAQCLPGSIVYVEI